MAQILIGFAALLHEITKEGVVRELTQTPSTAQQRGGFKVDDAVWVVGLDHERESAFVAAVQGQPPAQTYVVDYTDGVVGESLTDEEKLIPRAAPRREPKTHVPTSAPTESSSLDHTLAGRHSYERYLVGYGSDGPPANLTRFEHFLRSAAKRLRESDLEPMRAAQNGTGWAGTSYCTLGSCCGWGHRLRRAGAGFIDLFFRRRLHAAVEWGDCPGGGDGFSSFFHESPLLHRSWDPPTDEDKSCSEAFVNKAPKGWMEVPGAAKFEWADEPTFLPFVFFYQALLLQCECRCVVPSNA